MTESKPHILVSGANGLVGRRLAQALSQKYKVSAIVRSNPAAPLENVHYIPLDISKPFDTAALPAQVDTIFHMAQSSKFREFPQQAQDIFGVNIQATNLLLDYAYRTSVKRFVYASSGGIYEHGHQLLTENSPISPHGQLGYYLASKMCGEILAQSYTQLMTVHVVRFFFVYGPEQNRSMLIPRIVENVKQGKPITLQGADGISMNPLHVADAVRGLESLLKLNESLTLNMAGPETYSIRQIAELAGALVGKQPVFTQVDDVAKHFVADIQLMQKMLGSPSIALAEGIKDFTS